MGPVRVEPSIILLYARVKNSEKQIAAVGRVECASERGTVWSHAVTWRVPSLALAEFIHSIIS